MINKYGKVYENADLKNYNTYGIGGKCKYIIFPNNVDNLKELIKYLKSKRIKYIILGKGSNVILPDEDFNGAIIKLDMLDNIRIDYSIIAESGINLSSLINKTIEEGYISLNKLIGIPGSLGGAIVQNAGCLGICIFDFIKNVTILDENNEIKVLEKKDIDYSYRYTEFKNRNVVILNCELVLEKGNIKKSKIEMQQYLKERINKQPLEYKNAGSVFKNPEGLSAGKLIEECGLKGLSIGGAKISEKHANFIINFNSASSSDIIKLINKVKKEVKDRKNIDLELEQEIINW